jgi:hypothetical protein
MAIEEFCMDTRAILGMLHAEETLLVSIIRSLPPDIQNQVANDFHKQVEISETSHLSLANDHEANDAYRSHLKRLSILLAALS